MAVKYTPDMEEELNPDVNVPITPESIESPISNVGASQYVANRYVASTKKTVNPSDPWWKQQGVGDWGKSVSSTATGSTFGNWAQEFSELSKQNQSSKTTQYPRPTVPELSTYTIPERGESPRFDAPEWNEKEVTRLAQEHLAPQLRSLREAYQTLVARMPTNPQARLSLKEALAGYGTGLEYAASGAKKTARAEYSEKYDKEYKEDYYNYLAAAKDFEQSYAAQMELAKYQADVENKNRLMKYQADMEEYLRNIA